MDDDEKIVAEIPFGNRGDTWRATTKEWVPPDSRNGKAVPLIGVRKWTRGRDGTTMLPSKSGLSCAASALPAIRDAVRALCAAHGVEWGTADHDNDGGAAF